MEPQPEASVSSSAAEAETAPRSSSPAASSDASSAAAAAAAAIKTPVSLLQELYVKRGITPKYDLVQGSVQQSCRVAIQ